MLYRAYLLSFGFEAIMIETCYSGDESSLSAFSAHAETFGGICKPSGFNSVWLSMFLDAMIEQWKGYLFSRKNGDKFACTVGFTQLESPNGAAEKIGNHYLASISRGMSTQLTWLSAYILEQSFSFGNLATVPLTHSVNFQDVILRPDKFEQFSVDWIDSEGIIAVADNFTSRIHALLYHDMLQIALHHEIYHGLLGHLESERPRENVRLRMVEFSTSEDFLALNKRESQALEHHADHASIGSIIYRMINDDDSFRDKLVPELSLEHRVAMVQMASALVCLTWSQYKEAVRARDSLHPPVRVRYLGMLSAARQMLLQNGQEKLYSSSTKWAFKQLALMTNRNIHFSPLASLASPKIFAHVSKERQYLLETLSAVSDKLRPFVY